MTRVVTLDEYRATQARAEDFAIHTAPDVRTLAVEHAVAAIAHAVGGLDLGQRIAVEWALWWLVDDVAARRRDPW
jgi:hypothetical protein